MKRSAAYPKRVERMSNAAISRTQTRRLSRAVLTQKVDEEFFRPMPPVSPAEIQAKITLAEEQVAGLTKTLEWFLFESHAIIRNRLRDVLDDNWHHVTGLVGALNSEMEYQVAKAEGTLNAERRSSH